MTDATETVTGLHRADDLAARLRGLEAAVEAADGRLSGDLQPVLTAAREVVTRAAERMRLSADHTVVALAGATGSGKSSLFNALTGLDLASVGVKRPTTSWALGCSWGDGAEELLDWLGVPPRHQITRTSSLDADAEDADLHGLVLLDLPDHDSTEVSHHLEVQRLVGLADLLVWVLDPQKYADAAIHERYLRPLAAHAGVMLVVFNHVDLVRPADLPTVLDDARRQLRDDGLGDVPMLATSALHGEGVAQLRAALVERVHAKRAARDRLSADITRTVDDLASAVWSPTAEAGPSAAAAADRGSGPVPGELTRSDGDIRDAFTAALSAALELGSRRQGATVRFTAAARSATRWPPARLLGRRRRPSGDTTRSQPVVSRSVVSEALHAGSDVLTSSLPAAWGNGVADAAAAHTATVSTGLEAALKDTSGSARPPAWARVVGGLHWLALAVTLVGVAWLAWWGLSGSGGSSTAGRELAGVPAGLWLAGAGIVATILLLVAGRLGGRLWVRRRVDRAGRDLEEAVRSVVDAAVVPPVRDELAAYETFRSGLAVARGR